MQIQPRTVSTLSQRCDILVIPVIEKPNFRDGFLAELNVKFNHQLVPILKARAFTGKANTLLQVSTFGQIGAKELILVGLGAKKTLDSATVRKAFGTLGHALSEHDSKKWTLLLPNDLFGLAAAALGQAIAEGLMMGGYRYKGYKTNPAPHFSDDRDIKVTGILSKHKRDLENGVQKGLIIGEAVNRTRDLANTPSNHLTPTIFVDHIKEKFAKRAHFKVEIIDRDQAEKLGMHCFLAVAKGSVEPPFMAVVRYTPNKHEAPIALVGKGVTFDSGGISIKPADKMSEMKGDMSGAAAVLNAIDAIAQLELPINVIAVTPLVENMPSGNAFKPGDVIHAMNGKSVEIVNTDAEGRLILADALAYAVTQKASLIIDIATLTGACSVALGAAACAVLGRPQREIDAIIAIGEETGDRLWQLPLYDDYLEYLSSSVADIMHCTETRLAGTAIAAKFLEQFVENTPWIHLDIASQMSFGKAHGYTPKGMSGVGLRNMVELVASKVKKP